MSLSSPLIPANPNTLTNGTPADATQVMANFNNLVNNLNALLNSSTGAGYVGITSDTRWGGGASVQDALGLLKDQQQLTDTGSVNALVVTPAGSLITANVSGMLFLVKPGNTSTNTTPTLQVGTAPALTIVNGDGSTHVPGAVQANRPALFWVDTANSKAVHLNPLRVTISSTLTYVGGTTAPTVTAKLNFDGYNCSLIVPSGLSAISNSTFFTVTGLPSFLAPASSQSSPTYVLDNGATSLGAIGFSAGSSVINLSKGSGYGIGTSTFTSSGTKGWPSNGSSGTQAGLFTIQVNP